MSYETITIATAVSRIEAKELVLPAIQRDFVWKPETIYDFLDSVMRGYPFGTLLFWNTRARLQHRPFVQRYEADERHEFEIKEEGRAGTMVLDGQQRLQSLYVSLSGTHEGRQMHFDVIGSGVEPEDVSQRMYLFSLLRPKDAADRNTDPEREELWLALRELMDCRKHEDVDRLVERSVVAAGLGPFSDEGRRVSSNIRNAYNRLKADEVLSHYTIDRNYGHDREPTPVEEILEIFVRINSGGQVLSRSDLMFSLMQLHWDDAYDQVEDVRETINELGEFDFSKDFVLRCALVCCGRGARYDVDKLRKGDTMDAIRDHFDDIGSAIERCVQFVVDDARIFDERILGSTNSLIPFVYYLYHHPHRGTGDEGERQRLKRALYLSLMTGIFARFSDSRIDGVIREVIEPARVAKREGFPLEAFREFVGRREGRSQIDDWLLQRNITLLMNILENGTRFPAGRRRHRPEHDHIFPSSRLRSLGVDRNEIDHFANMRLVSKRHNIWKSNLDPRPYFEENPGIAEQYLIDVELLDYDQYDLFRRKRRRRVWQRVAAFLGIPEDEIPSDGAIVPGEEHSVLEELEGRLRDLIDQVLTEAHGEAYWSDACIPTQTVGGVKARIKDVLSRHPDKSWDDFRSARARLDFADVSDYEQIVVLKANWPLFESSFGKKSEFQRHLAAVRRLRNSVMHNRDIDEIERLGGEAGILYLRRAMDAVLGEEELPEEASSISERTDEAPTVEDFHRLLTRIPVARGQKQLFRALYDAGDEGLIYPDLVGVMGRRDAYDLAGVLGALGRRINGTPGFGKQYTPGVMMILDLRKKGGEFWGRLRPEFRAYLEEWDPPWLATEALNDRKGTT